MQGNASYPLYRRRQDRPYLPLHQYSWIEVNNRWVVPDNPFLLLMYVCHINIEICSSIKCVKYLYKYIHKGSGRVSIEVENSDEIAQYVDVRWICAPETFWKIYKFPLTQMCSALDCLEMHMPNMSQVRFESNSLLSDVLDDPRNSTQFFMTNEIIEVQEDIFTGEYYRWLKSTCEWQHRKTIRSFSIWRT